MKNWIIICCSPLHEELMFAKAKVNERDRNLTFMRELAAQFDDYDNAYKYMLSLCKIIRNDCKLYVIQNSNLW